MGAKFGKKKNFQVLTHLTEMSATGVVTKQIGLYLLVQLMAISDTNNFFVNTGLSKKMDGI